MELDDYVNWFNYTRPHGTLKCLSLIGFSKNTS